MLIGEGRQDTVEISTGSVLGNRLTIFLNWSQLCLSETRKGGRGDKDLFLSDHEQHCITKWVLDLVLAK